MSKDYTVAVVGLGYFAQFHLAAWASQPGARLVAVCDRDAEKVAEASGTYGVQGYAQIADLLAEHDPDIIDIVTPPFAHDMLVRASLKAGRVIVCQKPFCDDTETAQTLAEDAKTVGARVLIHENFRFQPWHRAIKTFLDSGRMGAVWSARFALRPGDGRGPEAYLDRQPIFQTMPRLMIHEVAVHFIDLFRWLFGPVEGVYADIRKLNPVIAGEDESVLLFDHAGGTRTVFDGNRLSDNGSDNPRYTMGDFSIEGEGGQLTLNPKGEVHFRPFGTDQLEQVPVTEPMDPVAFGGGCVPAVIRHVVEAMDGARPFENEAEDYMRVMEIRDAAYLSAEEARRITL